MKIGGAEMAVYPTLAIALPAVSGRAFTLITIPSGHSLIQTPAIFVWIYLLLNAVLCPYTPIAAHPHPERRCESSLSGEG